MPRTVAVDCTGSTSLSLTNLPALPVPPHATRSSSGRSPRRSMVEKWVSCALELWLPSGLLWLVPMFRLVHENGGLQRRLSCHTDAAREQSEDRRPSTATCRALRRSALCTCLAGAGTPSQRFQSRAENGGKLVPIHARSALVHWRRSASAVALSSLTRRGEAGGTQPVSGAAGPRLRRSWDCDPSKTGKPSQHHAYGVSSGPHLPAWCLPPANRQSARCTAPPAKRASAPPPSKHGLLVILRCAVQAKSFRGYSICSRKVRRHTKLPCRGSPRPRPRCPSSTASTSFVPRDWAARPPVGELANRALLTSRTD